MGDYNNSRNAAMLGKALEAGVSIRIACPLCNKSIAISPDRAGRTIKCPGCEEPLNVVLGKSLTLAPVKKKPAADSIAEKYKSLWVGIALALLGLVILWTVWKLFLRS